MIVAMATTFMMLCNAVTTKDELLVTRIRNTSKALYALDEKISKRSMRTVVPAAKYIEYKSVYLEAKRYNKEHENPTKTDAMGRQYHHTAQRDASPHHTAVTKADLQNLEGNIVAAIRNAKRDIIKDAHTEHKSEADRRLLKGERGKQVAAVRKLAREAHEKGKRFSMLQACRKTWQNVKGGYPSIKALYAYCHRHEKEF